MPLSTIELFGLTGSVVVVLAIAVVVSMVDARIVRAHEEEKASKKATGDSSVAARRTAVKKTKNGKRP